MYVVRKRNEVMLPSEHLLVSQAVPSLDLEPRSPYGTAPDVVSDAQLLKAVEILREKTSASAYSLASVLCVVKYVLNQPYFPETVFGNKKTVDFDFRGQNYTVEFVSCKSPTDINATPMDVDSRLGNNELLQQKTKESPIKLASLVCIVKAVLDDVGLKGRLFQNKIKFYFNHLEYLIDFDDQRRHDDPEHQRVELNGSNSNSSQEPNSFKNSDANHDEDEDMMDELEKDEIVEENHQDNESWRTSTPSTVNKRKRASDSPNSEDEHLTQQSVSAKRRSTDKHKAPPLSCEAVKRLFTGISKTTLVQRLEESKILISAIKESYANIRPSASTNLNSSPRLNLLCHLLQSPPTSRIDGISSKVFSNLELYKLFTTYNSYKEEVLQHDPLNSPTRRNHTSPSSDQIPQITFPTYSSFIDPTVTLHIKEQTGGREVGKHRLNCAWRLSILCELLGKGVLLMTKELSGAKLERILVEEFSKLVEFLKNPENQDWVSNVREKMELSGFDEVYAPLAEADIDNSAITGSPVVNNGNSNEEQANVKSDIGIGNNGGHVITFAVEHNNNIAQHNISSQVIDPRLGMSSEEDIIKHEQHYTEVDQNNESISNVRNGRPIGFVKGAMRVEGQKY
ncbi:17372_t:CDS:2 [Acaulospora morrowiae]|uniref:17372_t:CDS:1 n=1 Tax=Acaulospora morrowiae TaxID=94023 RepID=A0A9N8VSF5_9GLOM|nr:17372_t:CDS:2 [Acaulospora morrowiae]